MGITNCCRNWGIEEQTQETNKVNYILTLLC